MNPFARLDALRAAAGRDELTLTSFVAFAEARATLPERIDRSFRYERDRGAWVHLQGTAPRRSGWRMRTEENLQRAGYELWLPDRSEFDARRWLTGAADVAAELVFLEALGPRAAIERWPQRRRRAAASPLVRPRYDRAIERVRGSPFRPTQCWLSARLDPVVVRGLRVTASFTEVGGSARVFVEITDAAKPDEPLPVAEHRKLQACSRDERYEQGRRRSPGQRTGGSLKVVSTSRVIAETRRIRDVMADHVDRVRA